MALLLLAVPALLAALYLLALTLLSGRLPVPARAPARLRFDLVVPAHNEEAGIARTVANLSALDYPAALRRIVVVADNCTDATAERARAAGAHVLVRHDAERRGKGYALEYAFARSLEEAQADAVVVVDADTVVSAGLLHAFAARLEAGARAVQAEYGVQNPDASWRTRLLTIAFALFHDVRSRARERLGLSCGLRGNGMCFALPLLRQVPHDAFSVVEDVEYGLRLGLAGQRVHYAGEVKVLGEMVAGEQGSRSQRRRWEGGRLQLMRQHGLPLLGRGLAQRSGLLVDLALDILVPPLSWLAAPALLLGALALALSLAGGHALLSLGAWGAVLAMLTLYVLRGWWLSGMGLRGLADLACAPLYVLWKLVLLLRRPQHPKGAWVRTTREGESR
ncbi:MULTISPECIES: glycosyltransferase family 2 protein [Myxococcaceae]|uniref:glycosyltransferase family 2 protein n=1 Tax=Myxococcaceae TaxID=31 RepID=UPI00188ED355|nr:MULTISPECIES: glycosyltransferase family 2 protein [Myxococcaceae]MBF5042599.1 glycosyltransferase [Simulacricoccus sp. 17bor-14]